MYSNLSFQILQRLAGDPSASDKMQRFILKCQNQLRHMASLIDRLLDVTKIRTGTFELVREPIDLAGLLRDVVARFASDSAATPISLQAPLRIDGVFDRMRIDQALTNLLSNAVRYGAGKPIEVIATASEREIAIAVIDQGPGNSGGRS